MAAQARASSVVNTAFEQREVSQTDEKRSIADAIADYIPDGSTVFITIGTTVEHVARALMNHKHLRVITNSLRVAHILYKCPQFEVMVPGGTLRPHNGGIIGPVTTAFVASFRADYLVTSMGAIESDGALLEFDVNEANVAQTMMAHSRHILLAADHTKFQASAAVEMGSVAQATALFTDKLPGTALQNLLKTHQVEVILAKPGGDEGGIINPGSAGVSVCLAELLVVFVTDSSQFLRFCFSFIQLALLSQCIGFINLGNQIIHAFVEVFHFRAVRCFAFQFVRVPFLASSALARKSPNILCS